ncbi:MAG: hypothetical protein HQK77_10400 [Desulfobacterales bacterium]|nr:hypothetical protein [Desulfobacterales bacterium]
MDPMNHFVYRLKYALPILLMFIMMGCCALVSFAEESKTTLYFYSQEIHSNKYKSIKINFDTYLAQVGHYEFQPYNDKNAFEANLKDQNKYVVILSSWHYREMYKQYALIPLLVALIDGKKYHKNILVSRSKPENFDEILKNRIASANTIENSKTQLNEIFKKNPLVQSARILIVPKDIDALLSVGLGMSDSSIIMENSLTAFQKLYPQLYENIVVVAEGEKRLSLIIAAPKTFIQGIEPIVSAIENMQKQNQGKDILMLGIDGWQKVDAATQKELEE